VFADIIEPLTRDFNMIKEHSGEVPVIHQPNQGVFVYCAVREIISISKTKTRRNKRFTQTNFKQDKNMLNLSLKYL